MEDLPSEFVDLLTTMTQPFRIFVDRKQAGVKPSKQKLGDCKQGDCKDCQQPFYWREEYLVRPEVWEAAGEHDYFGSGLLHRRCLEQRLGRKLTDADLLVWFAGHKQKGSVMEFDCHPDAVEFLKDK